jgi:hypothetical protein
MCYVGLASLAFVIKRIQMNIHVGSYKIGLPQKVARSSKQKKLSRRYIHMYIHITDENRTNDSASDQRMVEKEIFMIVFLQIY